MRLLNSGGSATELSLTDACRNGAVIAAVCRHAFLRRCSARRWSILLTLEDLTKLAEFELSRLPILWCDRYVGRDWPRIRHKRQRFRHDRPERASSRNLSSLP